MLSTGDGYTVLGDDIVSYGAVSRCTTIRGARQANDFAFPPSFGGHGASRRTTPMCAIGLRTKAGALCFLSMWWCLRASGSSLPKQPRPIFAQSSIRGMSDYGTAAIGAKRSFHNIRCANIREVDIR
jgi:hypothetical protein